MPWLLNVEPEPSQTLHRGLETGGDLGQASQPLLRQTTPDFLMRLLRVRLLRSPGAWFSLSSPGLLSVCRACVWLLYRGLGWQRLPTGKTPRVAGSLGFGLSSMLGSKHAEPRHLHTSSNFTTEDWASQGLHVLHLLSFNLVFLEDVDTKLNCQFFSTLDSR